MTYVKINNERYPARITGRLSDGDWDGRESKSITLSMGHDTADKLFVDGASWEIETVEQISTPRTTEGGELVMDDSGEPIIDVKEYSTVYDNSDFCVAGDIIDHRDGTVTIKMGKYTNEELLLAEVLG